MNTMCDCICSANVQLASIIVLSCISVRTTVIYYLQGRILITMHLPQSSEITFSVFTHSLCFFSHLHLQSDLQSDFESDLRCLSHLLRLSRLSHLLRWCDLPHLLHFSRFGSLQLLHFSRGRGGDLGRHLLHLCTSRVEEWSDSCDERSSAEFSSI